MQDKRLRGLHVNRAVVEKPQVKRCEELKEMDLDAEKGGLRTERKEQQKITPSGATDGTAAREAGNERGFSSLQPAPSASQITKPPFSLCLRTPLGSLCLPQGLRATS